MFALTEFAKQHEEVIRSTYRKELERIQESCDPEWEWDFFCDQDQLYFLAEGVVPGLEVLDRSHELDPTADLNEYTAWLNEVLNEEAGKIGFDTTL